MIFCSKNPDARANRKGSLSSLPRQRAAEIGRKKATASCGSGREGAGGFIPAVPVHEQPAGLQRGCGSPRSLLVPNQLRNPSEGSAPHRWCAWKEGECLSGLSACALHQVSLLSAGWQEENAVVKGLQGTEKSNAE